MDIFNNHKKLYFSATALFLVLTFFVAILPSWTNTAENASLPGFVPLNEQQERGRIVYINEGCVGCHSQQVRNVEMDKVWGSRPGMASDYAHVARTDFWRNSTTLMGTERTGPDLTNVGVRQPGAEWNLVHLFQPRALVENSIMPAYPWLFEYKLKVEQGKIEVKVPKEFLPDTNYKVVASQKAVDLLAYLQSLKQIPLPDGSEVPVFLYPQEAEEPKGSIASIGFDQALGKNLYAANCQSCHQPGGTGLPGAFPPLKGSKIVLDENLETFVTIIMKGYDANPAFGVMPAVGTNANLNAEKIAAIMNHERNSWGNSSRIVTVDEIQKILEKIK